MSELNPEYIPPRYLYHGTSARVAQQALKHGLTPRSHRNHVEGNWKHSIEGHPDCVYLTDIYGPYYGMTSAKPRAKNWAVLEIDTWALNADDMRPDEDCLEQGTRNLKRRFDGGKLDMLERTEWFRERLDDYADAWTVSLQHLGTCAHKGAIPASAVTRASFYEWESSQILTMGIMDTMILIGNHKFVYTKSKAITDFLFGTPITAEQFYGIPAQFLPTGQVELFNEHLAKAKIKIVERKPLTKQR